MDLRENATKTVAHILESWLGNEYDDIPVPQFLSPVGSESKDFDEGRIIGITTIRMAVRIADAILSLIDEERRARVCGDNLHAERLAEERAEAAEARCAKLVEALLLASRELHHGSSNAGTRAEVAVVVDAALATVKEETR